MANDGRTKLNDPLVAGDDGARNATSRGATAADRAASRSDISLLEAGKLLDLAHEQIDANDLAAATESLESAVSKEPSNLEARLLLGRVWSDLEVDPRRRIALLEPAVLQSRDSAKACYLLAAAYVETGESAFRPRAAELAQRATEIDPDLSSAHQLLAHLEASRNPNHAFEQTFTSHGLPRRRDRAWLVPTLVVVGLGLLVLAVALIKGGNPISLAVRRQLGMPLLTGATSVARPAIGSAPPTTAPVGTALPIGAGTPEHAMEPGRRATAAATPAARVPAATATVVPDPRQAELRAMLERWLGDWMARDLDAYGGHYSRLFRSDGQDRAEWLARKRVTFARSGQIHVEISQIEIAPAGETLNVRFRQRFRSELANDLGLKSLTVVAEDGRLKIRSETWQPVVGD